MPLLLAILSILIRPQGIQIAPSTMHVEVHVTPQRDNQRLDVYLEEAAGGTVQISSQSLAGLKSSPVFNFTYPDLEGGVYDVFVVVVKVNGNTEKKRSDDSFIVYNQGGGE